MVYAAIAAKFVRELTEEQFEERPRRQAPPVEREPRPADRAPRGESRS